MISKNSTRWQWEMISPRWLAYWLIDCLPCEEGKLLNFLIIVISLASLWHNIVLPIQGLVRYLLITLRSHWQSVLSGDFKQSSGHFRENIFSLFIVPFFNYFVLFILQINLFFWTIQQYWRIIKNQLFYALHILNLRLSV